MNTVIGDSVYSVLPSRLAPGAWSPELDRQIGEGDIHASYSADRIGLGLPLRRPFEHAGCRWVCVGFGPGPVAWAYRMVHPFAFEGVATTYTKKLASNHGDDARADPMGFYHAMAVRSGGEDLVLSGPPARFIAGHEPQLTLF
ncbi:MAG: hypothetical protein AB7Q00_12720 [Phycisphaerales bacterium]